MCAHTEEVGIVAQKVLDLYSQSSALLAFGDTGGRRLLPTCSYSDEEYSLFVMGVKKKAVVLSLRANVSRIYREVQYYFDLI